MAQPPYHLCYCHLDRMSPHCLLSYTAAAAATATTAAWIRMLKQLNMKEMKEERAAGGQQEDWRTRLGSRIGPDAGLHSTGSVSSSSQLTGANSQGTKSAKHWLQHRESPARLVPWLLAPACHWQITVWSLMSCEYACCISRHLPSVDRSFDIYTTSQTPYGLHKSTTQHATLSLW